MKRCKNGFWLLLCMGLCALCAFPAFAEGRLLDTVYLADSDPADHFEVDTITDASGSNAAAAAPDDLEDWEPDMASDSDVDEDPDDDIMLMSDHGPYDTGSISTSVVTYMSDVVSKLGPVHYVLFRTDQYKYRLYYARDMEFTDSGEFWASQTDYVEYDTRYYTWKYGSESDFGLDPDDTMVYSDLGGYPMLDNGDTASWILVFLGAMYLLFIIFRSFFAPHEHRI